MILALDTSGGELVACLLDEAGELAQGVVVPGRMHQAHVLDAVARLLARDGAKALLAIAVARGPGSQTGLRVGLSTAEGLGFARRLPLLPLDSLAVAAHRAALVDGEVLALVSAGRRNVYARRFRADGPARSAVGERRLGALEEAAALVSEGPATVAAEPSLVEAWRAAGLGEAAPARGGAEALAAAAAEALGRDQPVAYDQLRGDYGE